MSRLSTAAFAVLLGLSLGACNVFEGLSNDAELSGNVEVLLNDGQRALEKGDSDEAVRIFTRAVEVTSATRYEGRIARIKLASALLQQHNLSVLELQDIVTGVVDSLDNVPAMPRANLSLGPVCSFSSPDQAYDVIDLEAVRGYANLRANTATLTTVRTLIQSALGLSTGTTATRAQLQAGLNSLLAEGADDAILAEALADGALASIGVAYDAIVNAGGVGAIKWVKVKPVSGDVYLGYCAASQAALGTLRTQTSSQIDVITSAVEMVDLRAGLGIFARDSVSKDLVREARAALERLQQELGGAFAG